MLFEDKVAVVTGGARGIGRCIVQRLYRDGAAVVIADMDGEAGEEARREVVEDGGRALFAQTNVTQSDQASELVKTTLGEFGRVDILINNAGITRDNLLMRMKEEDWDAVLAVNLKGAFNCSKAAIGPMIKARGGRIISIASVVGISGNPGQCNYGASKAGLVGFTKSLAREVCSRNITVNAVAPGFIPDTGLTKELADKAIEGMLSQVPLGRPGTPEDVAHAVAFLASDWASYITGHVLTVDGGMTM